MKCPGPYLGAGCPDKLDTPKGKRCKECRLESRRIRVREWSQRHKEHLLDYRRAYAKESLRWAKDVAPAPTIKTADKAISDAIKFCS